ncbi:MAG: nuclear transport factor 2 family protein [Actinomycetota bacterium]|nr:MAG: nuclear transport factor 2 family protein [Actinomycetota bacterium]
MPLVSENGLAGTVFGFSGKPVSLASRVRHRIYTRSPLPNSPHGGSTGSRSSAWKHIGIYLKLLTMNLLKCENHKMTQIPRDNRPLAEQVREAFAARDLQAFGALLSDDVTWGDVDMPRGCRNRTEVLTTLNSLLDKQVDGRITELETGEAGILCGLAVEWPKDDPRAGDTELFHVYMVRDGKIYQIRRYDDRDSAAAAVGIRP